jgi:hypothetical protein
MAWNFTPSFPSISTSTSGSGANKVSTYTPNRTAVPRLEFRIGTDDSLDLHGDEREWNGYFSVSYVF